MASVTIRSREMLQASVLGSVMTFSSIPAHAVSIVGGWGGFDSAGAFAINFLPDGQYMQIQVGPDDYDAGKLMGYSGIEVGTYTWNSTTGAFTNHININTNGWWGLTAPDGTSDSCPTFATGCVLNVNSGQLSATVPTDGHSNPPIDSVKSWYLTDTPSLGDLIVLDLLADGTYLMGIDPPSTGYYIYGKWDLSGALSVLATDLVDPTNPFYNLQGFEIKGDKLMLTSARGDEITLSSTTVSEPDTITLLGIGVAGMVFYRHKDLLGKLS